MKKTLAIFLSLIATVSFARHELKCTSPDNRIVFYFKLTGDMPGYRVTFKGTEIVKESFIDLSFADGEFRHLTMLKPVAREGKEEYDLIVGKASHISDKY